jgi:cell division septation protein DedD
MPMSTRRSLQVWIAILLALGVIGLAAYARGPKHHHGDEIGTHGTTPPALSQ